jgi:hypothetical protein
MSSFELREEVQGLQDGTYEIGQEHDVEAMDEGGIHELLDGLWTIPRFARPLLTILKEW